MTTGRLRYITTALLASAAVLYGCSGGQEEAVPAASADGAEAIGFRALPEAGVGVTRASAADFPNTTIGVTATYDDRQNDWTAYDDIQNQRATVADGTGDYYGFTWQTVKYWPADGAGLIFCAYSPHDSDSGGLLELDPNLRSLNITLAEDMPDVLYASGNAAFTSYNKTDGTADLGEFRHALSKLTVNVLSDDTVNPVVTLNTLSVTTARGSAVLDLLTDGDLRFWAGSDLTYGFLSNASMPLSATPYSETVYLFPGTEDYTDIDIVLNDSSYKYKATIPLSSVMVANADGTDSTVPVSLIRAATTTVNITVTGTSIQDPDDGIRLQGLLTDWDDKGNLEVTIN
ncbi:MAG: fimbrillin family protein [Rikenellaceae bacterium]|nr:fimbrillin family protein [Rikenellaceae bacterium]